MMYNAQNGWVSGLRLSFENLNDYKARRFGNWICFLLQVRRGKKKETFILLGPLERVDQ
jgi:hypothetical protein